MAIRNAKREAHKFHKSINHINSLALCLALCLAACEQNPYRDGELVYQTNCANCHLDDGQGLGALIPPLTDAGWLAANRGRLACIVRRGLSDTIIINGQLYAEQMPGVPTLSEIDVTNVLNYVQYRWAKSERPFTLEEVKTGLQKCE